MSEWDFSLFNQKLGNKISFGVVVGQSMSGKTTISKNLSQMNDMIVIDMKQISEQVRASLGTEDEPFEGDVPVDKVEAEVHSLIGKAREENPNAKFLFDGYVHKEAGAFLEFINKIDNPDFVLCLEASEDTIKKRTAAKNEADDVDED